MKPRNPVKRTRGNNTDIQCDICNYFTKTHFRRDGKRQPPAGWRMLYGVRLCPQCSEINARMNAYKSNRAFCYVRASTNKQEISLEIQEQIVVAYCEERKLDIVDIWCDQASASKLKFASRPAGNQLYASIEPGDHIVVAKYDRAFRDSLDCLTMYDNWTSSDISLHFAAEGGLVAPTPMGKFVMTMMVAAAELEAGHIAERQQKVTQKRRKEGRPKMVDPVLGFKFEKVDDPKTGKKVKQLILCPEHMAAAKQFHQWYHDGRNGYIRIVKRAKHHGFRTPQHMRFTQSGKPKAGEFYTLPRVRRLILLWEELEECRKKAGRELNDRELTDLWIKEFYAKGRTKATEPRRNRRQTRNVIQEPHWEKMSQTKLRKNAEKRAKEAKHPLTLGYRDKDDSRS